MTLQQLALWSWHKVEEKRVQMKEVRLQGVWQGLKQKLSCLLKHCLILGLGMLELQENE